MHCTLFAMFMLILGGCGIAPAPQIYVSSAYIPGADINNLYSQAKYNQPSDKTHRIEMAARAVVHPRCLNDGEFVVVEQFVQCGSVRI